MFCRADPFDAPTVQTLVIPAKAGIRGRSSAISARFPLWEAATDSRFRGKLDSCDRFSTGVRRLVDMPERLVELLRRFLKQNGGRLSARARQREFSALTDAEARDLERLYADSFDGA